ncbi:MAG: hypothetical protein GJ680_07700 [Alteromonadaceae bacterium]|nr:hypothetical protein [Alteromonadaceae bacterium]
MKTIFELIVDEMLRQGDSIENVIATTHSVEDLKGTDELELPQSFTIWTTKRVYFPSTCESQYNVESVPRNPCEEQCGVMY